MLKRLLLLLLVVPFLWGEGSYAAVAQQGTDTHTFQSSTTLSPVKTIQYAHTVSTGCDILIVTTGSTANHEITGTPTWNGANLTIISEHDPGTSSGDSAGTVWGLISPTAATGNVSVVYATAADPTISSAMCFSGVNTTSVAAATNDLETIATGAEVTTLVFASAGTAGNAGMVVASGCGDDRLPISNNQTFTELRESVTDGGAGTCADLSHYIAFKADPFATAITVTFTTSDEISGSYIELVAAVVATPAAESRRRHDHAF